MSTNGNATKVVDTETTKVDETIENDIETSADDKVNERLLSESKKYKSHYQKLKSEYDTMSAKLKTIEESKQAEQGKYKELYESEKKRAQEFERKAVKQAVDSAIHKAANKSGCKRPDALMRLGNTELLQYDDQTGEVHGVEVFLEDIKASYPEFFTVSNTRSVINPVVPSRSTNNNDSPVTLRDAVKTTAGFKAMLEQAMKNK